MITSLRLKNFKNFQDVELKVGHLTMLVGTNAAGKTNLRDAFQFLQEIARGYSIAEIIGTKYGAGGEVQWRGIRGGTKEIAYADTETFIIEVSLHSAPKDDYKYSIEVVPGYGVVSPYVIQEELYLNGSMIYSSRLDYRFRSSKAAQGESNHDILFQ